MITRELRRGHLTLRAQEWGQPGAPLVVLQHGLGSSAGSWQTVAPYIADHCSGPRRVLVPDLRGHGRSDWDPLAGYDVAHLGGDLAAWIRTTDEPCLLIGHSLGAAVALNVASGHPALVAELVLEDGGLAGLRLTRRRAERHTEIRTEFSDAGDAMAELERLFPGDTNEANYDRRLASFFVTVEGGRVRWRCDVPGVISQPPDPELLENSWTALEKVQCPLTLIVATRNSMLDPDVADRVLAVRPTAAVIVVAEAGHDVHNSKPADYLQVLDKILDHRETP